MEYKDRSVGLIVFGVLTVGLGMLCTLFVVFVVGFFLMAGSLPAPAAPAPPRPTMVSMIPAVGVYGMLAVALTWLGIGSILAARWARALLLIFSWSWLTVGVLTLTMMAFILPGIFAQISTPHGRPAAPVILDGVMAIMFLIYGVILVVAPAIWTFFFSSRHVKATCEARHPAPAWTDACPLPVLGVVAWLAYSTLMTPLMPITGMAVLPFFGTFLTGLPAVVALLLLGAVYGIAAWRMYRLDLRGWSLLVGVLGFFLVSGLVTFARHDILDMYRAMNLPPDQLAQMEKMNFFQGNWLLAIVIACFVPIAGYLGYIRRYFHRPAGPLHPTG